MVDITTIADGDTNWGAKMRTNLTNLSTAIDALNGAYKKPVSGIPLSDLTTTLQASLAKADTAVQPAGLTKAAVGLGNVDNTSDTNKPVSTAQATAIAAKYTKPSTGIPEGDLSSDVQTKLNGGSGGGGSGYDQTARDAAAAAQSTANSKYTKPSTGIPATDLATAVQTSLGKADTALQSAPVSSVAGRTGAVTLSKSDVGLANVDNTADTDKPVSSAQSTAIAAKYSKPSSGIPSSDLASAVQTSLGKADTALQSAPVTSVAGRTGAVTLTKSDVSLANVDNTSDTNKPVSTAQASAIAAKYTKPSTGVPETDLAPAVKYKINDTDGITEYVPVPTAMAGLVGAPLTIPTHDGSGQTTHPSVVFVHESWNGYRYWMAHTPYANSSDALEDPNLAVSNDGITWVNAPGVTQPLDDAPGGTNYNSDPDLVLASDGTMYYFWRNYMSSGSTGTEEKIYVRTSTDGVNWTTKQLVLASNQSTRRLVSPSFIEEYGRWTMYAVDIVPTNNNVVRSTSIANTPTSGWETFTSVNIGTMQSGKNPWHLKVIKHNGRYSALLNDTTAGQNGFNGDLLFMTSGDGITFTNSGGPVIPRAQANQHDQLYRATLLPAVLSGITGFRVWYSAKLSNTWNVFRTFIAEPVSTSAARQAGGTFLTPGGTISNGTGANYTITFPAGRFSVPPLVMGNADSSRFIVSFSSITATSANMRLDNVSPAPGGVPNVNWFAVQMTASSAAG